MQNNSNRQSGFAWLEVVLVIALLGLLVQLFPSLLSTITWFVDVRNWSRATWFLANVIGVTALISIRFGPSLIADWKERRLEQATKQQHMEKQLELKKQRETLERQKESRQRRIY